MRRILSRIEDISYGKLIISQADDYGLRKRADPAGKTIGNQPNVEAVFRPAFFGLFFHQFPTVCREVIRELSQNIEKWLEFSRERTEITGKNQKNLITLILQ